MQNKLSRIIAIGSPKGGVGKSTLTQLLAVEAAHQGKMVIIIDGDASSKSMTRFTTRRQKFIRKLNDRKLQTLPSVTSWSKPAGVDDIRQQILTFAETYDYVFIDNHGAIDERFKYVCNVSDMIIFPTVPHTKDQDVISDMADAMYEVDKLIKRFDENHQKVPVLAVQSMVDTRSFSEISHSRMALKSLAGDFILARTMIKQLKIFRKEELEMSGLTPSDIKHSVRGTIELLLKEVEAIIGC